MAYNQRKYTITVEERFPYFIHKWVWKVQYTKNGHVVDSGSEMYKYIAIRMAKKAARRNDRGLKRSSMFYGEKI